MLSVRIMLSAMSPLRDSGLQVMGSEDPRHMFSAYIDPEGANIPDEIRGMAACSIGG